MSRLEMPEAAAHSQSRTKSRVVLLHTRCRKSYPLLIAADAWSFRALRREGT